jgi:hypothetical protein
MLENKVSVTLTESTEYSVVVLNIKEEALLNRGNAIQQSLSPIYRNIVKCGRKHKKKLLD